jgi:hypothetical protein
MADQLEQMGCLPNVKHVFHEQHDEVRHVFDSFTLVLLFQLQSVYGMGGQNVFLTFYESLSEVEVHHIGLVDNQAVEDEKGRQSTLGRLVEHKFSVVNVKNFESVQVFGRDWGGKMKLTIVNINLLELITPIN